MVRACAAGFGRPPEKAIMHTIMHTIMHPIMHPIMHTIMHTTMHTIMHTMAVDLADNGFETCFDPMHLTLGAKHTSELDFSNFLKRGSVFTICDLLAHSDV